MKIYLKFPEPPHMVPYMLLTLSRINPGNQAVMHKTSTSISNQCGGSVQFSWIRIRIKVGLDPDLTETSENRTKSQLRFYFL